MTVAAGLAARRIADARREVTHRLKAAGIESPDLDARLLIAHALGLDHGGLVRASEHALDDTERDRIEALTARRLAREPIARITGFKEFWGLPLALSPAALVPRPETETVVERALTAADRCESRDRAWRIADLGTGSGAIMLALLSELPNAFAIGTDREPAALTVARFNAHALGMTGRTAFVACDFGAALGDKYDLVVSNPPYIRSGDIAGLAVEVRDYDPLPALDGGPDGLAAYRVIAADAKRLLSPGGHVVVEIGHGQCDAVCRLFSAAGLGRITPAQDLAGIPRTVMAMRDP